MDHKNEIKESLFDFIFACACIVYAICCVGSVVLTVIYPQLFWGPLAIAIVSIVGSLIFGIISSRGDKEEQAMRKAARRAKRKQKEYDKKLK